MNSNDIPNVIIATHSGGYHADDVFACAVLSIYFEQQGISCQIIRTRDQQTIQQANYVLDVGSIYNPEENYYDHHQPGGAGERENGIPYAAFGLVWKKFGASITSSQDIAIRIDQKLVQPIDAIDNGITITQDLREDLHAYTLHNVLQTFAPSWAEDRSVDDAFHQAVLFAKDILTREIVIVGDNIQADTLIQEYYQQAKDPRIVIVDDHVFERGVITANMIDHPEVLLVVYKHQSGNWNIVTMRDRLDSFESRILLPENWAGKNNDDLQSITNVPDAIFCHQKRFLCGAETKAGALALAKQALEKAGV